MNRNREIERIRANGWGSIALSESAVDKSSYGNCRGANWLEPSPPTTHPISNDKMIEDFDFADQFNCNTRFRRYVHHIPVKVLFLSFSAWRKIGKKRFTIFVPIKQYCFDKALLSLFSLFLPFLFLHTEGNLDLRLAMATFALTKYYINTTSVTLHSLWNLWKTFENTHFFTVYFSNF